jgi:hypothetical protein
MCRLSTVNFVCAVSKGAVAGLMQFTAVSPPSKMQFFEWDNWLVMVFA